MCLCSCAAPTIISLNFSTHALRRLQILQLWVCVCVGECGWTDVGGCLRMLLPRIFAAENPFALIAITQNIVYTLAQAATFNSIRGGSVGMRGKSDEQETA